MKNNEIKVPGALILGYSHACINLKLIVGSETVDFINEINPTEWYPLSLWNDLSKTIIEKYDDYDPILQQVGEEMMNGWYNFGPGKDIVTAGVMFLHYQTGSEGYYSVVKGPPDKIGDFKLKEIDVKKGHAIVVSTTPFHKSIERGVLIGGMKGPGDLGYIDVNNDNDKNCFQITFY